MLFDPTKPFAEELARLQAAGKISTNLTATQRAAIEASIRKYAGEAASQSAKTIAERFQATILDLLNPQKATRAGQAGTVTEGMNPATAREALTRFIKDFETGPLVERIDFALDVGTKVANGAGRFVQQNADPEVVDAYPALEYERLFDRETPRGFKRGPGGEMLPDPGDDWPSRWERAAADCGDEDAARVLRETGRMVALKSSGIWQALGDGVGGYDDTLGNPYDPLAWNTGYRQMEVAREDAEALGLLDKGEEARPAPLELRSLFAA